MTQAIDPIAAPAGQQRHEQNQPQRHGLNYGGAMTHREAVQARLRVNPAAVTERMRETPKAQAASERQAVRQTRLAEEDEAAARREEPGQRVDIEV
ncbi:MAG TPA: hypothetical protein PLS69_06810 [Terricaulis sp.]|mgnify:FL=1|nr:hypothetical protein [Terricaulis sp.]